MIHMAEMAQENGEYGKHSKFGEGVATPQASAPIKSTNQFVNASFPVKSTLVFLSYVLLFTVRWSVCE